MAYSCCAYGCRSEHDKKTDKNISFHKYPFENRELIGERNGQKITHEKIVTSKSSKLCSSHFTLERRFHNKLQTRGIETFDDEKKTGSRYNPIVQRTGQKLKQSQRLSNDAFDNFEH